MISRILSKRNPILFILIFSVVKFVFSQELPPMDPEQIAHSNNYIDANRTATDIHYIVMHTAEGYYQGTIGWFRNPSSKVSAHYVISKDGRITQTVYDEDIARHVQKINIRDASIGIEHEGFVDESDWARLPDRQSMYISSAKLVRHLAIKYGIPRDREHILGHGEVDYGLSNAHTDPWTDSTLQTTYWDWDYFMQLVTDDTPPQVSQTLPVNNATNIPIDTDILISFSEEMDKSSVESAFSVIPAVSGKFTWSNGNTLRFIPEVTLEVNTDYTVLLNQKAKDLAGNSLENNYFFTFRTSPEVKGVDVVIVIDKSGMMSLGIERCKEAAVEVINSLNPLTDRVAVVSFGVHATVNPYPDFGEAYYAGYGYPLGNNFLLAKSSILKISASSMTNVTAGLLEAYNQLGKTPKGKKKVLLVYTDWDHNYVLWPPYEGVLEEIAKSGIPIYAFDAGAIYRNEERPFEAYPISVTKRIIEESGGKLYRAAEYAEYATVSKMAVREVTSDALLFSHSGLG